MDTDGANLVAGLFRSQTQADAALRDLHRIGLTDADLEVGAPAPGRYRIEYHESQELGKGVATGIAIGVPVGGVTAVGFLMFTVPGMAMAATIGLGMLIGGFWGIFFGGLGGMALKVLAQTEDEPRYAIATGSPEVLVIAHAGDQIGSAHEVMQHDGARYFLEDVPAVRPLPTSLAATR